jgi:hypothetical protein
MSIALRFKSILRFGITAEQDLMQREHRFGEDRVRSVAL